MTSLPYQNRRAPSIGNGSVATPVLCLAIVMALAGAAGAAQNDADDYPLRADGLQIAVDPGIPHYKPCPPLQGDLFIGGGSAPVLIDLWQEIFHRAHPSVIIHRGDWTKAAAMGELIDGDQPEPFSGHKVQVCYLGEDFLPYELWYLDLKQYYPLMKIPVIGGPVNKPGSRSHVVLVHGDNPLERLTMAQVDAIYSKTRKLGYKEDIVRWGQLGLTGEWADKPIHPWYMAGVEGGAAAQFKLRALGEGGELKDNVQDTNESAAKRYPPIPGRHPLDSDRYAIVEGSHAYDDEEKEHDYGKNVKIIALGWSDKGPFYSGTLQECLDQTYPLAYRGYLVIATADRRTRDSHNVLVEKGVPKDPIGAEFVRVALSREGQEAAARTQFLPLPARMVKSALGMMEGDPAKYKSASAIWP